MTAICANDIGAILCERLFFVRFIDRFLSCLIFWPHEQSGHASGVKLALMSAVRDEAAVSVAGHLLQPSATVRTALSTEIIGKTIAFSLKPAPRWL